MKELKRLEGWLIVIILFLLYFQLLSGIEEYNNESVNISIQDYKLVTRLQKKEGEIIAERNKAELNSLLIFKYNPI